MTKLDDLRALYEAVKAGTATDAHFEAVWTANDLDQWRLNCWASNAHRNDDLNAALGLHEALLPGWVWTVCGDYASVSNADGANWRTVGHFSATAAPPARAWLLAQIAALMAMEGR